MSKLTAIEALNFMSLKQIRIEFDETGILNLTGYNDSGKSAITRLLEVLFYDAYSNEQVNFIHDGEDMFGVGVEFDDGVSINKYKYKSGKSVWEMLKGEEVLYTNQLANGIASMNDVPEPIAKYLNVVEDEYTGEKLNIRRNTDKLFLVGMSGGEVYKIINTVLHFDTLAETVKRLNEDRNKEQAELTSKATSAQTLKSELKLLRVLDDSTVASLQDKTEKLAQTKQRIMDVSAIAQLGDNILRLEPHPELTPIDTTRYRDIKGVVDAKAEVERTQKALPPEIPLIDTTRINHLKEITSLRQQMDVVINPEIPVVNTERFNEIKNLGQLFNNKFHVNNQIKTIESELQEAQEQLRQLSAQHGFKICKNCGTVAV